MIHSSTINPQNDPWEAYLDIEQFGASKLTNIEVTMTIFVNMGWGHCLVGFRLSSTE